MDTVARTPTTGPAVRIAVRALLLAATAIVAWLAIDQLQSTPAHAAPHGGSVVDTGTVTGTAWSTATDVLPHHIAKGITNKRHKLASSARAAACKLRDTLPTVPPLPLPTRRPPSPAPAAMSRKPPPSPAETPPPARGTPPNELTDQAAITSDDQPADEPGQPGTPLCPTDARISAPTMPAASSAAGGAGTTALTPNDDWQPAVWSRYRALSSDVRLPGRRVPLAAPPG